MKPRSLPPLLLAALLLPLGAVAQEPPIPPGSEASEPTGLPTQQAPAFTAQTPVHAVLRALGEPMPDHWVEPDAAAIQRGLELITEGVTTGPDGEPTAQQSKGFVCTHCHNTVREDPDLRRSDPEARMAYVVGRDLPLLQGTTLYGLVDRATWFNGDYEVKYGSLVEPARRDLREAIQLCSVECSQGRPLADWEIDAILAWGWSSSLRYGDLEGAPSLDEAATAVGTAGASAVAERIRASYLQASPATFGEPPARHGRKGGYEGLAGDTDRGADVYRRSCLHCHDKGGPGHYRLLDKKRSYRELLVNMGSRSPLSFYEITRHGTKPHGGTYMPHFPLERLSDQQVEDLRSFLQQAARAKGRR